LFTAIIYWKYVQHEKKKKKIRTLQQNEETSGKILENNTRYPEKNEKWATREFISD
jgi:hypothetical protein